MQLLKIAILASGRGSNAKAILESIKTGALHAEGVVLLSDNPEAEALLMAQDYGVPAILVNRKAHPSREAYEAALLTELNHFDYNVVCLAGYMRVLGEGFLLGVKAPVLNIHPSLLPSFPGLHAQRQALDYGVKVAGCTVHLVDAGLDSGPILLQRAVPVLDDDTEATLSARILKEEHQLYTEALQRFQAGITIQGRTVKASAKE